MSSHKKINKEVNFNWIDDPLAGKICLKNGGVLHTIKTMLKKRVGRILMTGKSRPRKGLIAHFFAALKQFGIKSKHKKSKISAQHQFPKQSDKLLEIYLPCPRCYSKKERRGDFREFFEKRLNNIDEIISGQPIFLDRNHALRYSRYMGLSNGILKAYVADSAIEGSDQELSLKSGYLNKELVHGFYVGWNKSKNYITNPVFNQSLLVQ